MIRSVNSQIPKPETGSGFEHLVADLADAQYNSEAHRNARSGQSDDGVDVYVDKDNNWIGIQCKNTSSLSEKELREEVSKAEGFSPTLSHFIIATTAPLDRDTQEFTRNLSENNDEFSVDIWTWDDITRRLNKYPEILEIHYGSRVPGSKAFDSHEEAGLIELSDEYFEDRTRRDPADCWRTGFSLAEVKAGYPFDRPGISSDSFVAETLDHLSKVGDSVLLGHPGSGKSTVCRMVACEWKENQNNRVFYRPSDTNTPFSVSDQLVEELCNDETDDLVVVEDPLRDSPDQLFQLIQRVGDKDCVRFLLDSRSAEWNDSEDRPIRAGQSQATTAEIRQLSVPPLSRSDVQDAIDHYSNLTNQEIQVSADVIFKQIENSEARGDGLLLAHLIDLYSGLTSHTQIEEVDEDLLYFSARDALEEFDQWEGAKFDTAILISLLSAAGIGVTQEIVHGLVSNGYSHHEISSSLDELNGDFVFGASGKKYQTRHELWCSKFLKVFLENQTREVAIDQFESVTNAIFRIIDDPSVRSSICDWIRRDPFPEDIDKSHYSDFFVTRVFSIGVRNPELSTLFTTTEYSNIDLPDSVSEPIEIHTRIWRGVMRYERSGVEQGLSDLERAKSEFEHILELSKNDDSIPKPAALELESLALTNLAAVNFDQSDYSKSKEHLTDALDLSELLGDTLGQSHIYSWMGNVEVKQSNVEKAEQYYREGIRYDRELCNQSAWAAKLSNLGEVKSNSGEYDAARRLTNTALEFFRETNDKRGQAICYSRLSDIDRLEGKMESAVSHLRHSLRLRSDSGSEVEIANSMLGFARMVAGPHSRDPPISVDDALDFAKRARKIYEKTGNRHGATVATGTIGSIKIRMGYPKEGIKLQKEAIEVYQELGDKSNIAAAYNDLSQGYLMQGRLRDVVKASGKAIEINQELREQEQLAISLFTHGQALFKLDFEQLAIQDMAESAATALEINAYPIYLQAIDYLRDIHPEGSFRYGLSVKASIEAMKRGDTSSEQYFKRKARMELIENYPQLHSLVSEEEIEEPHTTN